MEVKQNKLNLGCEKDYRKGYINLDYNSIFNPDVIHDLNVFPYPFTDNYFDEIYCSHILEHVNDFFKTIEELLRITKIGGIIHIRVPHFSNGWGYSDLTHKRFFGWKSFDHLIDQRLSNQYNFKIIDKHYNYFSLEYPKVNMLTNWFFRIIQKGCYERFLCWIIPVNEIELKLEKTY
jgi:ubiquinone/menaquinone biosynthesis C-methylase UbiE